MHKRIDFSSPTLEANGNTYKIVKELSINRFRELEKLEIEAFYGFDAQGMFDKLKNTWNDLNKSKVADATVKIYQLMEGMADKVDKREPVMLRICSLFLIKDGENVNEWNEELANEKIEDWSKEGYAIDDFFSLAASLVPGFIKNYEEVLANTFLGEETPKKSGPSKKK